MAATAGRTVGTVWEPLGQIGRSKLEDMERLGGDTTVL